MNFIPPVEENRSWFGKYANNMVQVAVTTAFLFALVAFIAISYGIYNVVVYREAQSWPKADATVSKVRVEKIEYSGTRVPYFEPRMCYAYKVEGKDYSDDVAVAVAGRVRDDAEMSLAPYSSGVALQIHYSPNHPERSFWNSNNALSDALDLILKGAGFLVLALVMMAIAALKRATIPEKAGPNPVKALSVTRSDGARLKFDSEPNRMKTKNGESSAKEAIPRKVWNPDKE